MQLAVTFPSIVKKTAADRYYEPNPNQWTNTGKYAVTQYAYVRLNEEKKTAEQLCVFHTCRDYMSDYMVQSKQREEKGLPEPDNVGSPYSFIGNFNDKIHLIVGTHGAIKEHVGFLNEMEKKLHVARTEVFDTDKPGFFVVKSSDWWKRTSLHWSWFMQMVRYLNDPNTKPGVIPQTGNHATLMKTFGPFEFFKFPVYLKAMGKPTKGHSNVAPGKQYYHGGGGYYTFCSTLHMHKAAGKPSDPTGQFTYTTDILKVLEEEQKKCAASPVTAS